MEFIDKLELELKNLLASIKADDYKFGREPLPMMDIVERYDATLLPFKFLLNRINHMHGLGPTNG